MGMQENGNLWKQKFSMILKYGLILLVVSCEKKFKTYEKCNF